MTIKTTDDGFSWMESFTNLEKIPAGATREYRLDRMSFLSQAFGNPQEACRIIHVAGSKGKGSTSLFLASGLTARGYRTGLYTSPHLVSYKERITLAGREIEDAVFLRFFNEIRSFVEGLSPEDLPGEAPPTTFELLTLLALLIFRELKCSWVVLETGLGGRLDATNIVTPEASVITPIEREHTEYLGETIPEIAREKGGIVKKGRPVFCGFLVPAALEEIRKIAAARESACTELAREARITSEVRRQGETASMTTRVEWLRTGGEPGDREEWNLAMQGPHQGQNAALAALVLRRLFASRGGFPPEVLKSALETARLPGRMEVFRKAGTLVVLDGAHTPDSLALTVDTFRKLYGDRGVLLFGSVQGKPVPPLAAGTVPLFHDIIISRAGTFKPEDPREVYRQFREEAERISAAGSGKTGNLTLEEDPESAIRNALERAGNDRPVLVTGSFYMAAAVRPFLTASPEGADSPARETTARRD